MHAQTYTVIIVTKEQNMFGNVNDVASATATDATDFVWSDIRMSEAVSARNITRFIPL